MRRISPSWRARDLIGEVADPDGEVDPLFHQIDHAIRQPRSPDTSG